MKKKLSKGVVALFFTFFALAPAFPQQNVFSSVIGNFEHSCFIELCRRIKDCYPENFAGCDYGFGNQLPYLDLTNGSKRQRLYYKQGRILPKELIKNADDYLPIFGEIYPEEIPDPATFSKERIKRIEDMSRRENRRKKRPNSYIFIQNFIFNAQSKKSIEAHLVQVNFLYCTITVNEKIKTPLKNVERKLRKEALSNPEIEKFITQRKSISGYNWREVRDTYQRSSHSWGISIDYLPSRRSGKQIYWKWVKENIGDDWMLYPLKYRWIPDGKIIEIFESEGFIWGGKWELWDNMHFEYHPELLYGREVFKPAAFQEHPL